VREVDQVRSDLIYPTYPAHPTYLPYLPYLAYPTYLPYLPYLTYPALPRQQINAHERKNPEQHQQRIVLHQSGL
jgi:hypothetical protein